jgi:hypothetical protein
MWFAVAESTSASSARIGGTRRSQRILEGLELFAQTKTQVTAVMMKVIVAEQFLGISDDDEVTSLLDSAEFDADARSERSTSRAVARARSGLGQARRCSGRRARLPHGARHRDRAKAHSLALRAALDMYDLLVTAGRGDEGRDLLSNTHQQRGRGVGI